MNENLRNLNL